MEGEVTVGTADIILTSWRDIADYMGKGVRTVQRWEQDFDLPVHRGESRPRKAILARSSELDAWATNCCETRSADSGVRTVVSLSIRKRVERLAKPGQADERLKLRARAVLTSWKEIALYVDSGVRTVQRWERDFGFPVRRPKALARKAILARPCDIDRWLQEAPISASARIAA